MKRIFSIFFITFFSGALFAQEGISFEHGDWKEVLAKAKHENDAGKRGKEFLMGYLKKRAVLKLPSAEIIEEAFELFTSQDLNNSTILSTLLYYDPNIEYEPQGKFYKYVIADYRKIDSVTAKGSKYSLRVLQLGINNYFQKNI